MTSVHTKRTVVKIGTNDISSYCTESEVSRSAKTHDVTGYGLDDEVYTGGVKGGKISLGGWYDNSATTGPAAVLEAMLGTQVAFTRNIDGTGTGKPTMTCDAIVETYVETAPVSNIVTWKSDLQVTGPITKSTQA